jgi:hypothetical protein
VKTHPFIEAEKLCGRNVARTCELLEVSRAAFYARRNDLPSARATTDATLVAEIRQIHQTSGGTYGSPRVHAELSDRGRGVGRRRVTRLMRSHGVVGRHKRRWRTTTVVDPAAERARDLIQRDFATGQVTDRRYVGDITYIATWEGFAYLATVIDLASRRVVGWAIANHMRTSLVEDALRMAFVQRRPERGVIFHTDRGSQGEFNWPSQHLDHGGVHGTTVRMECWARGSPSRAQKEPTERRPHLSRTDSLTGSANDRLARRPGSVLGGDRFWAKDRCRRHRSRCLIPRRV